MQNEKQKPMTCEHCNEEMVDVRTIEVANQIVTLWKCPYCDQQEVEE